MIPQASASILQGPLVQIEQDTPVSRLVPSRFNARTSLPDGTLVLYNSYTGALSGFPQAVASIVEGKLHKDGFLGAAVGINKYLLERGFLVSSSADELDRVRLLYGSRQYRRDELELILLTSEDCNFRCLYCYETFPRGVMESWVQRSVVKLIHQRASRLNRLHLEYFGGEPLLGLQAIRHIAPEAQRICIENNIEFGSGMTTNGYLLTRDVFLELLHWGIRGYQVTLDGSPQHHNTSRPLIGGGPTFERIISNLDAIRRTNERYSVVLRVNFSPDTLADIDSFLSLIQSFRGDERFPLRFYPIGKWGGPNDGSLEICGLSGERERQALDQIAAERGFVVESRLPYLRPRGSLSICYAARPYNLIIGADGKLMKCTVALDTKDYNIVGRLSEDGRADIDVDRLTKWIKPYFEEDSGCKSCFFLPSCQGISCPVPRIENGERPCPPHKTEIQRTLASVWTVSRLIGKGNRADLGLVH
jgi:uncharacterized protein